VLDTWTVATFAPLVGETFVLEAEPGTSFDVRLVEATDRSEAPAARGAPRAPFSLIFAGPPEPFLSQRIRRLDHPALGSFELFLVPIDRDEDGVRYEAAFG
jgi:hypothetical protein